MSEYIVDFGGSMAMLARIIESQSANLREEIVRCRDCKFRCFDECTRIDEGFKDYWFAIEPDGFCSFGERKEGGE